MTVTDQDLQRWHELSEKATLGPWDDDESADGHCFDVGALDDFLVCTEAYSHDAAFIAASRTAIPALIAEVKALRKLVDSDAEHAHLVLLKDATEDAAAEVGPKMDASYGESIERLAGEKEKLLVEVERLSNVYAVAASLRTFPVSLDDHLRLVDAVDAAVARSVEGQLR